jgi:eukaryotic-like serine/threonine-protein kinase
MMPAPWRLWEGQVVDSWFPLRRYLGGSERTAVYLTQYGDPQPRNAAIKLVLVDSPEADPAEPWQRAANLSHPNLLGMLRTGRCQLNQRDLRYAVTEFAEENLADVLAERALTTDEVRDILKPLVDALAYIHSEGLVHGHLKPANLMAVGDELKLSIDGVTLVGESGAAPAAPGPYDPPEFQERGCSPVGDVWSLGVTLVEALTQRLPEVSGTKQDPVLADGIPAEFLPIVQACLRADPRRRASLDQIVELLWQPKSVPAPEPAAEATLHRPTTPRTWLSAALVCGAAVALAGILVGPRLLHHPVANAEAAQVTIAPPAASAVAAPPEAPKIVKPSPMATPTPAARPSEPVVPTAPPPKAREHVVEAVSGQIVHQVMPEVPEYARRTIRGVVKVQVRATVDAAGHVTETTVESQNSRYFAKLAVEAAKQWEFAAAPGNWLLRFEFTQSGDRVHPSQVER